jgi:hypothetical protein
MEFFLHFQKAIPSSIIGKHAFDALHPFCVKIMKDRNVCCCIYHVELEELRFEFNYMHEKSKLHFDFHCDYEKTYDYDDYSNDSNGCMGKHATYRGLTTLWETIVCTMEPHAKWHA